MEAAGNDTLLGTSIERSRREYRDDRPNVLARGIQACRKGGTVSVPGVYAGFDGHDSLGASMKKGSR